MGNATVLEKLIVEYIPINDLQPNGYNPNKQNEHDFELLCKSIQEDGFTTPIIALRDKTIVDGEHRWRAAVKLGYKQLPVVFVDMTPEQARIATLRHNRARGSEDIELTAQLFRDLEQMGALDWAQDSLLMDDREIELLLQDVTEYEIEKTPLRQGKSTNRVGHEKNESKEPEDETIPPEMEMIPQEIFRLSLVYSGQEATIVKGALGDNPAQQILQWCQEVDKACAVAKV